MALFSLLTKIHGVCKTTVSLFNNTSDIRYLDWLHIIARVVCKYLRDNVDLKPFEKYPEVL